MFRNTEDVFTAIQAEFERETSCLQTHCAVTTEVMTDMCEWYWPSCAMTFVVVAG